MARSCLPALCLTALAYRLYQILGVFVIFKIGIARDRAVIEQVGEYR